MNILAHNVAAKLSVAFVAVAMLFTLATPAQAQTTGELQQMINDLLAQVATLQAQLGGGGSTAGAGVCPYTWTRSLTVGDTGADVMKLQQFLNSDPDTRVAATGVGSAGQETQYYGGLTGAAVSKFQSKYRSDVLSPLGLVNPTTYFGPSTMAKANSLCATAMADSADDSMADDSMADDTADDGGPLSGGEASLENFNGRSGDDTDLEEGQNDAPVADFDFDVDDGDIRISRIDLTFVPDGGNTESDAWDVFENVSIWVDGDKVAEKDADSKSDWMDDEPIAGEHTIRITGLNWVGREGDNMAFTVGVSVQNSVDGTPETWTVQVEDEGIRGRDGAGVDQYVGDDGESVDFTIDEEGGDDELNIRSSSADPDSTTIAVDDSTRSGWETIFAFDLDTKDSVNDITVETIVVNVALASSTGGANQNPSYNDVVNDAQLVIDGDVFDDFTIATGNQATTTLSFDIDDDLVIDAGDRVTAEFQVRFNGLTGNYDEGQEIVASTTAANGNTELLVADGADDLTADDNQISGAATGDTHTLRTEGVILELTDTDTNYIENNDQSTTDNEGEFTIEFDVTAFETDVYINATAASGTTMGTLGANFTVTSGGTVAQVDGISADLTSTADEETAGRFHVPEGETESFTLSVVFDPETAGFHRVNLYSVNWNTADANPNTQQLAVPATTFRTSTLNI